MSVWTLGRNRYIAVLLLGLAAGSSIVSSRFAVAEIHPILLLAIRMGIAFGCFVIFLAITRPDFPPTRRAWFDCVLAGVLAIGLPLEFSFLALQYLSSGLFTIFLSFTGMGTMLVAHLLLPDEQATTAKLIGAGLAFAGVVLLIVTRSTGLAGAGDRQGYLFALTVVLCFSFGNVYARRRLRQINPFMATAIGIGTSFLLSLFFTGLMGEGNTLDNISLLSWSAAVYSSIVGSFLYFGATYWTLRTFGATTVGLAYFVIPVVSALLGALLLGEIITLTMLAGASLVFLGLVLVNRPEARLAQPKLEELKPDQVE